MDLFSKDNHTNKKEQVVSHEFHPCMTLMAYMYHSGYLCIVKLKTMHNE